MKKNLVGTSIVALSLLIPGPYAPLAQASADVVAPAMGLQAGPAGVASQVQAIKTRVLMAAGKFRGRLTAAQKSELLDIKMNIGRLLQDKDVNEKQKNDLKIELEDVNDMLG